MKLDISLSDTITCRWCKRAIRTGMHLAAVPFDARRPGVCYLLCIACAEAYDWAHAEGRG